MIVAGSIAAGWIGCRGGGVAPPRRVVLVTLDTLRADHLGCYGYPRDITPALDRLSAAGVRFTRAYSSSSTTVTAHASIFTSLFPPQHQLVRNGEILNPSVFTMAQLFRQQGYHTAAFSTVGFVRSLDRGFEVFDTEKKFFPGTHVVSKARAWLAERDPSERLFVWIHLFDAHEWIHQSNLDPAFAGKAHERGLVDDGALIEHLARIQGIDPEGVYGPEVVFSVVDRYDDQVLAADAAFAEAFDAFTELGLQDGTLWIVTADHGEGIGSHLYLNHGGRIYDEQIRVPLILYSASEPAWAGRVIDRLVRHVDLLPTLADLLGAPLDQQIFDVVGQSLLPLLRDGEDASFPVRYAFAQRREADERRLAEGWEPGQVFSLVTSDYKVIVHTQGEDELYDLRADPRESVNLIGRGRPQEGPLREQGRELFRAMSEQGLQLGRSEIQPEHLDELKALGYL